MKAGLPVGPIIRVPRRNYLLMEVEELKDGPFEEEMRSVFDRRLSSVVFVAFDTETTGLNPVVARLVELSGVKFRGDGTDISTFSSLINPGIDIPAETTAVHGITNAMVAGAPDCASVISDFFNWAAPESTILLAHNASFDVGFLEVALCRHSGRIPRHTVVDTLSLSRRLIADSPNHQLKTLVEHLGIPADTYHRALADSFHVRALFLKFLELMPEEANVADLLEIGGMLKFRDPAAEDCQGEEQQQPQFRSIRQAIATGRDLRLNYSGARKSVRTVTPKTMLYTRGNYYLSAYCHFAQAERTFRVDKIIRMEIVDRQ